MTKPVTIPNTFATATTAIPLSQLDSDFSTVATALNDANTYSNYAADTGVVNAYVVTLTGVSTTYSAGLRIQFKAGNANTGASTLNVNGGGTKNITFQDASALSSGTIAANAIVDVMYDGTQFLLMNDPAGTVGTGDVVGPAGATANAAAIFDSTTGKLIKDSKVIITPVANSSTLTIANNKTVTVNNTLTLSGTDSTTMTFPSTNATIARTDSAQTFTGAQTFNTAIATSSGGTGLGGASPFTANGVLYASGASALATGSALTFDGTTLKVSQGYVISWQSVQTTGFTAVAGRGYPCNTTSAAFTVTLPASPSAGDIVSLTDYAGTWGSNNLTVNPNGGKINGSTSNVVYNNSRYSVQLVYVDSTQGWLVASGWSVGTFSADFLVVAGGGAGGGGQNDGYGGGGGGAGGYRTSVGTTGGGGSTESSLTIIPNVAYTVTVGAGGAGATNADGSNGNDSVFASITSTKGGGGAGGAARGGKAGGSGGGSNVSSQSGGLGTANQGYAGGKGDGSGSQGGGGGGAGGAGGDGTNPSGVGLTASSSIDPTTTARGGGGAGNGLTATSGGGNGGSNSVTPSTGVAGSVNTGGGGGGGKGGPAGGGHGTGGNGGRGVVIIKIPDNRTATFSSGVTSTLSTAVAGFKIYTVTQTSTTSETVIFS